MMDAHLIKNATVVNEGKIFTSDLLIRKGRIEKIAPSITPPPSLLIKITDASGKYLFPGVIDDQVHFREPGLTHKAEIYTEAKAAVAGGVTTYMEMPNTSPPVLTQKLLEDKYRLAEQKSLANFSFYMGVSNGNLEEVLKTSPRNVCGIKIFMGSSTGNMLVDNEETLNKLFARAPLLIAVHAEDETTIRNNLQQFREKYGEDAPPEIHPLVRNTEACYKSSSLAVSLARTHGSRLHVLHISTAKELELFSNKLPPGEKRITAEACIHHLWFSDEDYKKMGTLIKWNPAVKTATDRDAILQAVIDNRVDVIATDHAPHTLEEKKSSYFKAPSGGPLVQHSLVAMLELFHRGKIKLEKIAEKMCHHPAICYRVEERGFIREGYHADLVIADPDASWMVSKENILYKCGWSPFEGITFRSKIVHTFVNGHHAYDNGVFHEEQKGQRLLFNR